MNQVSSNTIKKTTQIKRKFIKVLRSRNISVRIAIKNRKDKIFSFFSMLTLFFSTAILLLILGSVTFKAYNALTVRKVLLPIEVKFAYEKDDLSILRYKSIDLIHESLNKIFVSITDNDINCQRKLYNIISSSSYYQLASFLADNPRFDDKFELWFEISGDFEKKIRNGSDDIFYYQIFTKLREEKRIKKFFNKSLFLNSNSRIPEDAGILGALVGSMLTIIICLFFALPIGVMSGICLSELLPKNIFTNVIEVTINNLAAVPSIIFGILGFTIYLGIFDIPRSSSLAGGMTLSLMMLPNLIIATKHAFSTVPNSVKDAAFALGASKMSVIAHHSFAIALPAIIQATILSIARILGESSPLLMIGMVAFIIDIPKNFLDSTTVLPVQIYMWTSNPDNDFVQLAAVAIIALLIILLVLNLVVSVIRKKFDYFTF